MTVLVALPDEAQAGKREHVVDAVKVLGVRGNELGKAAGGDGLGVRAELGDETFQDSIHKTYIAVIEADLDVVRGAGTDDLGGLF